ncbi:MAG: hypothetical protein ACE5NA_10070 [Nitrospiraceae bacterium]
MKPDAHESRSRRLSFAGIPDLFLKALGGLVIGVIVFATGSVGMVADRSAEASVVMDTAGWPSGQVTGKQTNSIRIDGRAYLLHGELALVDDEGKTVAWSALAVGSWVKFHMKDGRIDRLVLLLPR